MTGVGKVVRDGGSGRTMEAEGAVRRGGRIRKEQVWGFVELHAEGE